GDLQDQGFRRHRVSRQQPIDGVDQVEVQQVGHRQVDRDRHPNAVFVPGSHLAERQVDHAVGDLTHQTCAFGGGEELLRKEQTPTRVVPPEQCLDAVHAAVLGANLGLVVTRQLAIGQCCAQLLHEVVVV